MGLGKNILKRISHMIPDKLYLKIRFKLKMGKSLDLSHPHTFNEKLQWLKIHDRKESYTTMVDKYEAKRFISTLLGEEHIIKTIGVWDRFEDIDFSKLPNKFVLKSNNDSGGVVICHDKDTLDLNKAKAVIKKSLRTNYFYVEREWPYKSITPRIIAEDIIEVDGLDYVPEFKIFCFNGVAKLILACMGKAHSSSRTNTFFDLNFKPIPVDTVYNRSEFPIEKPALLNEMIKDAELLSRGMRFLRVDFYCTDTTYYIGELTLYHNGGLCPFNPPEYDLEFGKLIKLPCDKE